MRTKLIALGVVAAAAAVLIASALGASSGSAAKKARVKGPSFKVAFPQPDAATITEETIKVKAPKGASVKSLSIKPAHPTDLSHQEAIAGAVVPVSHHGRTATFKVYVFIHTFPGPARRARTSGTENFVDVETNIFEVLSHLVAHRSHPPTAFTAFDKGIQDCSLAWAAGFYGDGIWSDAAFASLQSSLNQPSPPESVIDDIVHTACNGQAEGPHHQLPEAYDDGDD
jgi:hypothetical protein